MNCAVHSGSDSLLRDIMTASDCVITDSVASGYAALSAPGGLGSTLLTAALTIYVALVGYRLVLGQAALGLGEIVGHFIKIAVVLTLVTNWSAFQTLVFATLFDGPEQIASFVIRHSQNAAAPIDVLTALQALFDQIGDAANASWGVHEPAANALGATPVPPNPPIGAPQFEALALWLADAVMLASSVGVLLVVRIILGLLLVLAPLFAAALLFPVSAGLFEGWLRVTLRFALVPLFTLPFTAALVAVLTPFAAQLETAESLRDGPVPAILLLVLVFAAVLWQSLRLSAGIVAGIRLPGRMLTIPTPISPSDNTPPPVRDRTQSVLDAVQRMRVYGEPGVASAGRAASGGRLVEMRNIGTAVPDGAAPNQQRLGQASRRIILARSAQPVMAGERGIG
jgi:type IV secretion system protein VirB6